MSADTGVWLREQLSNPQDIFNILLLVGSDVIRRAIAQMCGARITLVCFSFGWVSYAIVALLAAVGDKRLMPAPDFPCLLVNLHNGFVRQNHSWILARVLRDLQHWNSRTARLEEAKKLQAVSAKREEEKEFRSALRVLVYDTICACGKPAKDWTWYSGVVVMLVQFSIAAVAVGVQGEWLTLLVTSVGTLLAITSSSLPQWRREKHGVRHLINQQKNIALTAGNGSQDVLVVMGNGSGMDLEALASPQRNMGRLTPFFSGGLALCWFLLLLCASGLRGHSWFILAVGALGMLHNVFTAGVGRRPESQGIRLQFKDVFIGAKVMEVLADLEVVHPRAGCSLLPIFMPGVLRPREAAYWEYARRRASAWESHSSISGINTLQMRAWDMPPLRHGQGSSYCADIPTATAIPPVSSNVSSP